MEVPKEDINDFEHTSIKAYLNLIPIVGGTFAEIFNAIIAPPIEKRKREWMENVSLALTKLEIKVNDIKKLLEDEEFTAILISATIIAYKTHLKEKHRQLQNAIVNSFDIEISFDLKQIFLGFVDELTLQHMEVIKFIMHSEDILKKINDLNEIYKIFIEQNQKEMDYSAFRFLIKDLDTKGIIFASDAVNDLNGQVYEASIYSFGEGATKGLPFIKITEFGSKFIRFIDEEY